MRDMLSFWNPTLPAYVNKTQVTTSTMPSKHHNKHVQHTAIQTPLYGLRQTKTPPN